MKGSRTVSVKLLPKQTARSNTRKPRLTPAGRYRKGADFERKIKKEIESKGWLCFRVAGSHSPFDLIAIARVDRSDLATDRETARGIQCKAGGASVSSEARHHLTTLGATYQIQPYVATPQGFALAWDVDHEYPVEW